MSVPATVRARAASAIGAVRSDRALAVVAGATAVGAVLRVAWVLVAARPPTNLYDPARYVGYAEAIGRGQGMVEPLTGQPTAYFPPGYPWFLGIIEAVLVHTPLPDDLPLVAGLAQAVLGTASIVAVAVLARRLHSAAAGAVAAVAMAVYPNLVLHTAALLSETLAIALLLGLLVALVPPSGDTPWPTGLGGRRLVGAGLLLGGLLLVRPVSGGVVVALALALLAARAGVRRTVRVAGAVAGIGALCILPWTARNAIRMDAFVPLSTNTGDNLCIGHGPGATGAFRAAEECATGTGVQDGAAAEVRSDDEKTRIALRLIREGWREEPGLVWDRFVATVDRDDDAVRAVQSYGDDPWISPERQLLLRRICGVAWRAVAVLGLAGLVRLARRRRGDRLLVPLAALGLLAAPLATFGDARFKVPIVPLLIVAAAVLVTRGDPAGEDQEPSRTRSTEAV